MGLFSAYDPVAEMQRRGGDLTNGDDYQDHYDPYNGQAGDDMSSAPAQSSNWMNMPGNPGYQVDSSKVNSLLAKYGIRSSGHINPFENLPDTAFWQHHDKLGAMLNGAISAAAFARPSNTIGEGIGVAGQMIAGSRERNRDFQSMQLLAPFKAAKAIADMQHDDAQDEYMRLHGAYFAARAASELRGKGAKYKFPTPLADGSMAVFNESSGEWEHPNLTSGATTLASEKEKNIGKRFTEGKNGAMENYLNKREVELGRQLSPDELLAEVRNYKLHAHVGGQGGQKKPPANQYANVDKDFQTKIQKYSAMLQDPKQLGLSGEPNYLYGNMSKYQGMVDAAELEYHKRIDTLDSYKGGNQASRDRINQIESKYTSGQQAAPQSTVPAGNRPPLDTFNH